MRKALILFTFFIFLLTSCSVSLQLDTSLAMHHYKHSEGDWLTESGRPWGTSKGEYYIDTEQEAGSLSGKGLSDNMQKVLGEDVIEDAAVMTPSGAAAGIVGELTE